MKIAAILLVPLGLLGATAIAAPRDPGSSISHDLAVARIGETIRLHGVRITPLRVIEDSRCPARVACVWAGRLRLSARIDGAVRELALGQSLQVTGGTLRLTSVIPERQAIGAILTNSYHFGFRFYSRSGIQLIKD